MKNDNFRNIASTARNLIEILNESRTWLKEILSMWSFERHKDTNS